MKATLEFDLTLPEEKDELMLALKAGRLSACIFEFNNKLRALGKHQPLSDEESRFLDYIKEAYHDTLVEFALEDEL